MSLRRLGLVGACAALLVVALPSQAATTPAPQVTDPAGDALLSGGFDLVSARLTTTSKPGSKAFVPWDLVVTVTFTGPPDTGPLTRVELNAASTACTDVAFTWQPGSPELLQLGDLQYGSCDNGSSGFVPEVRAEVRGNTIVWEAPYDLVEPYLPVGTTFSDLRVTVDLQEPATGVFGTANTGGYSSVDLATSTRTYTIGK